MPRKTLSYHEITKAAEDQIRSLAQIAFESKYISDRDGDQWVHGITLLWTRLAGQLVMKDDRAAQIALDEDPEVRRLPKLYTDTLEKLREEAAQAGKEG
tara:strand:- start:4846 stop:5142 length:297 start_codon:yes stop_codon:yes gene_type:complete